MERTDATYSSQDGALGAGFAPRSQSGPRTIAFMNQKGGVGKTTTTVNLGAAFARLGRRCLLIDLDPQAHCTLHLGIEPEPEAPTAYELLLDGACTAEEVIHRAREHLDLIPAETSLAAAEVELTTQPGREMILREKLEPLIRRYDYVMFDCPPSLGLLTLNALVASREVIIPMQAHFLPLQGVGKLLETIALVRQRLNRELSVAGIVLCSHDGQTTLAKEIVADLREFFGSTRPNAAWQDCEICEPPIRRNIKLAEAPSFGQTIFEYAPWCAGAQDYAALAENLLIHFEGGNAEPRESESNAPTPVTIAEIAEEAAPLAVVPSQAIEPKVAAPSSESCGELEESDEAAAEVESPSPAGDDEPPVVVIHRSDSERRSPTISAGSSMLRWSGPSRRSSTVL